MIRRNIALPPADLALALARRFLYKARHPIIRTRLAARLHRGRFAGFTPSY